MTAQSSRPAGDTTIRQTRRKLAERQGRRSMPVHLLRGTAAALLMSIAPAIAQENPPMTYPETRQTDTEEVHFGVTVADPFRWLENDPRQDAEVAQWIAAQNAVAAPYLEGLSGRDVFHRRLTAMFDHETLTPPVERGGLYFFTRNGGLDNQAQLLVREGADGANRILIDPNTWSEDGTVAPADWAASPDGAFVAFAMQDGGLSWRTIRVKKTSTGEILDDTVEWARFTTIAWHPDGSGFYYSRFPGFPNPRQGQPSAPASKGMPSIFIDLVRTSRKIC